MWHGKEVLLSQSLIKIKHKKQKHSLEKPLDLVLDITKVLIILFQKISYIGRVNQVTMNKIRKHKSSLTEKVLTYYCKTDASNSCAYSR